MKRTKIFALSIAALAIISGYGGMKTYMSQCKQSLSELYIKNVEALCQDPEDIEMKFNQKVSYTVAGGESIHYIISSDSTAVVCIDVTTYTSEVCTDEGGVLTCNNELRKGVQHNITELVVRR